jgi:hypothetical protein
VFGALCIEGPKWCGKTWTSLNHAESVVYMGDPTNNFQNQTMSLYESGDSNGQVSLAALFDGKLQYCCCDLWRATNARLQVIQNL